MANSDPIEEVDDRIETFAEEFRVDWWYDPDEDQIHIAAAHDSWGDPVPFNSPKREHIKTEIRRRHSEID